MASEAIHLQNIDEERLLLGSRDKNLRFLQKHFGVKILSRNGVVRIEGEEIPVKKVADVLNRYLTALRKEGEQGTLDLQDFVLRGGAVDGKPAASRKQRKVSGNQTVIEGTSVSPRSKGQAHYLQAIDENHIIFSIGPAGTGKTFLAVAKAVSALRKGQVRKLILVRPAVEAGESLGYLPGDFKEKVNPYLRPLYDALNYILEYTLVHRYMENGTIEIVPLAYMRGRTLEDAFIILDEAQNTTPKQMMMFLTRMGIDSKIVVTGDVTQIDLPKNRISGLIHAAEVLKGIEGVEFVTLSRSDIVRHRLVQDIVEAYGQNDFSPEENSGETES